MIASLEKVEHTSILKQGLLICMARCSATQIFPILVKINPNTEFGAPLPSFECVAGADNKNESPYPVNLRLRVPYLFKHAMNS